MISLKHQIRFRLYGTEYMEVYRLDSMLDVFKDTKERDYTKILEQNDRDLVRIIERLIRDRHLAKHGELIWITSEGLVFLSEGGYSRHFIETKRSNIAFWVSILSIFIALASFILSFRSH